MTRMIVVCFDVCDEKRLYRVARELGNFGSRVQKSVFECHLTGKQLQTLQEKLARLIVASKDHVRYYPMCATDREAVAVDGPGRVTGDYEYLLL